MNRRFVIVLPFGLLLLIFLNIAPIRIAAQESAVPWQAWESKDIAAIGDDSTGSSVTISEVVTTPEGSPSLQVTPSGASEETKLAVPFTGADLQDLVTYSQVELEVYLPEENTLLPNRFFLGMADVTGEFVWAGGVFSDPIEAQPGWNRVAFTLDPSMREPVADHRYMLFLSFFKADESENKTPLTEPFYLGGIQLTNAPATGAAAGGEGDSGADVTYQQEVDILLRMDDEAFLDAVARETFDYFWYEANPDNGLIKDRSTPDSPSSIAAVGFGLSAIPLAVDRGWISYDRGYERVLTTLQTFLNGGVQGDHGFFFHFVDMETGERAYSSEVSSIDTALLLAGALTAGQYFEGTEVESLANQLYENADWEWMMAGRDTVAMGWNPSSGFISSSWDHFDESMILYALAIGSPTHPIPAEAWEEWDRPANLAGGYIYLINEPLFVYQYPLAYLDLQGLEDAYANYWNNTTLACERNRQFAIDNASHYATYDHGVWGLSASDGPRGYRAYGASGSNHDGTIAPYASVSCLPFTPEYSLEAMRAMLREYGPQVWREYGFVSAVNEDEDWYSTEHIGIDEGDLLLMIANYQDGFVWNLTRQNAALQTALDAMGFVPSAGDYAITPDYLAQLRSGG